MRQALCRQVKHTFKSKAVTQRIMGLITAATAKEERSQALEGTSRGVLLLQRWLSMTTKSWWTEDGADVVHTTTSGTSCSLAASRTRSASRKKSLKFPRARSRSWKLSTSSSKVRLIWMASQRSLSNHRNKRIRAVQTMFCPKIKWTKWQVSWTALNKD